MYYNACKGDSPRSALGVAVSDNIEGPYKNKGIFLKSGMEGKSEDGTTYHDTSCRLRFFLPCPISKRCLCFCRALRCCHSRPHRERIAASLLYRRYSTCNISRQTAGRRPAPTAYQTGPSRMSLLIRCRRSGSGDYWD